MIHTHTRDRSIDQWMTDNLSKAVLYSPRERFFKILFNIILSLLLNDLQKVK